MSFFKKIKGLLKGGNKDPIFKNGATISELRGMTENETFSKSLSRNIALVREYYGNSFGLKVREFRIGSADLKGAGLFVEGMVERSALDQLFQSLLIESLKMKDFPSGGKALLDYIKDKVIPTPEVTEISTLDELFTKMILGNTVIFLDGVNRALSIDTKGWRTRAIEESDAETSLRGPREGFIESIHDNLALIRRRIPIPQLWIENFKLGSLTKTDVALVYIKGLAGESLLEEVRSRFKKVDTDMILESGQVEGFLEDSPYTLFPLMLRTERIDRVAAALLEGQVAFVTNGTPFVLLAPATFFAMLQAPDDSFEKPPLGSFLRLLRYASIIVSTFLPGIYIAIINFHPELLPTILLLRIAATREGVPFPVVIELLIMESVFELLREAGVRLPASIGPAISIVGALVLGDAAISAGIVSPPVVIIVALTAIASFATPNLALGIAGRLMRFVFVLLGAVFGLFGIQFGLLLLIIHLCALRSFGVPYLTPAAPMVWRDMKDHIMRVWSWSMTTRPKLIGFREPVRKEPGITKNYFKPPTQDNSEEEEDEDEG